MSLANNGLSYTNQIRHHASSSQRSWIHLSWSTSFTTISTILKLFLSLSWKLVPNFWLWILKPRPMSTGIRLTQPLHSFHLYTDRSFFSPFLGFNPVMPGSTPVASCQPTSNPPLPLSFAYHKHHDHNTYIDRHSASNCIYIWYLITNYLYNR